LLDGFAVWRIFFVGVALLVITMAVFFWMKSKDASDDLARAVAVNTPVIGQVFYLLNSRFKTASSLSFAAHMGNRYLPLGIGAVAVLQLLFTYAPPFQRMFNIAPIPLDVWPWLLLAGALFFLVVEAEKFVVRSLRLSEPAKASEDRSKPSLAPGLREQPPPALFKSSDTWAAMHVGLAMRVKNLGGRRFSGAVRSVSPRRIDRTASKLSSKQSIQTDS
jgi:Cation transporting ATPase, C-terminus